MSVIKEYYISEPPTSGELRERAYDALQSGGILTLTLLGNQEVPRPQEESVTFRIKSTHHRDDGSMIIGGMTEDYASVVVNLMPDLTQQAIASIVSP
jgi:hypothetical protein